MNDWMNECMKHGWKWMNEWVYGGMNECMEEWMNENGENNSILLLCQMTQIERELTHVGL